MAISQDIIQIAKFGSDEELQSLIDSSIDLNELDEDDRSLLYHVVWIGKIDRAKLLISHGATFKSREEKFIAAVIGNVVEFVKEAIDEGVDINLKNDNYQEYTALMHAADDGNVEVLKLLIENNADLELGNEFSMTALYVAAWMGQPDCLSILIESGADINAVDKWGVSPVAAICEVEARWEFAINTLSDERIETLKILLENGADPNIKNNEGLTALDLADQNYHLNAKNILRKYGALEGKYL